MVADMDAKTRKREMTETVTHAHALAEAFTAKRDRLLAALTLIAAVGLIVALPFALRAGAEQVGRIHVAEALSYRRQAPRN